MPRLSDTDEKPNLSAKGLRFGFVVSRYNSKVTKEMLDGGLDAIAQLGGNVDHQLIIWAPGAFEIPVLAKAILDRGGVDGVITFGCVMTGETLHNQYIASEVARGCGALALQYGKPVTFGVLTPNTAEQAWERADRQQGNKGAEATLAAIEVVLAQKALQK